MPTEDVTIVTVMPPNADPVRAVDERRLGQQVWQFVRVRLVVLAWAGAVAAGVALLFAYLFPQDFRREGGAYLWLASAAFMVRTFQFHIGLGVLVCAALAAALRRWRLLPVAVVLTLFCTGSGVWSYVPKHSPATVGGTLRVMSVNLLGINGQHGALVAEVLAADADVVFIQEYMPPWHAAFSKALAEKYPYSICHVRNDFFGQALYSRRPFVDASDDVALGQRETPLIRAVIELNGRDVALYNVHLVPPKARGRREQRLEFADLCELLRAERLPMIVAGDFNFTGTSSFAGELRRLELTDAHDISGVGRGSTWPDERWWWSDNLPGLRLDHIYLTPGLTSTESRVGEGKGSDHRPVVAVVGWCAE